MNTIRLLAACSVASFLALSPAKGQDDVELNLRHMGLKTLLVQSATSCELLAPLKKPLPLLRRKSNGELNAFGLGIDCPRNIMMEGESVHVVAFAEYDVSKNAFVGYGKSGNAMKIVRNFDGKTRGVSRYKGFRYIFYAARN